MVVNWNCLTFDHSSRFPSLLLLLRPLDEKELVTNVTLIRSPMRKRMSVGDRAMMLKSLNVFNVILCNIKKNVSRI